MLLRIKRSTTQLFPIVYIYMCHYLSRHKTSSFAVCRAILGYMYGNERIDVLANAALHSSFTISCIFRIRILSITSLLTSTTFCKVNGTSMSLASCSKYNQPFTDILHQWNAEEMTLFYAWADLDMPISHTDMY